MGDVTLRLVALDCIRKQAEPATESKSVSSIPSCSLLLVPVSRFPTYVSTLISLHDRGEIHSCLSKLHLVSVFIISIGSKLIQGLLGLWPLQGAQNEQASPWKKQRVGKREADHSKGNRYTTVQHWRMCVHLHLEKKPSLCTECT